MDIGPGEAIVALAPISLLVVPARLPRTARSLGCSVAEPRWRSAGPTAPTAAVEPASLVARPHTFGEAS
ncbi:MAG: hypothetical protein S0880_11165 [Actinomycetota bacterium]|nr:hypothetical protein [Actinomycetota bacterium]